MAYRELFQQLQTASPQSAENSEECREPSQLEVELWSAIAHRVSEMILAEFAAFRHLDESPCLPNECAQFGTASILEIDPLSH